MTRPDTEVTIILVLVRARACAQYHQCFFYYFYGNKISRISRDGSCFWFWWHVLNIFPQVLTRSRSGPRNTTQLLASGSTWRSAACKNMLLVQCVALTLDISAGFDHSPCFFSTRWDDEKEAAAQKEGRQGILTAMKAAENKEFAPVSDLFEDVYVLALRSGCWCLK